MQFNRSIYTLEIMISHFYIIFSYIKKALITSNSYIKVIIRRVSSSVEEGTLGLLPIAFSNGGDCNSLAVTGFAKKNP